MRGLRIWKRVLVVCLAKMSLFEKWGAVCFVCEMVNGKKVEFVLLVNMTAYVYVIMSCGCQERPYHDDSTASRLLSEVKHHRAKLVLRWGTTLESLVLFFWFFDFSVLFPVLFLLQTTFFIIPFPSLTPKSPLFIHSSIQRLFCLGIPFHPHNLDHLSSFANCAIFCSHPVCSGHQSFSQLSVPNLHSHTAGLHSLLCMSSWSICAFLCFSVLFCACLCFKNDQLAHEYGFGGIQKKLFCERVCQTYSLPLRCGSQNWREDSNSSWYWWNENKKICLHNPFGTQQLAPGCE